MVKAVALSTLQFCRKPGVRGSDGKTVSRAEVDEIAAGAGFSIDAKGYAELEERGLARKAEKTDDLEYPTVGIELEEAPGSTPTE